MKINFNTIISNYSKVTGKSILRNKPVHIPDIKFKDLSLANLDRLEITNKKIYEILPENKTIFSWAKQHPTFNLEKIDTESMVLVHRTSYFPKNGKILSTNLATKEATGVGEARTTIHFALNRSVNEHAVGNPWDKMEYAIITPFKETLDSIPKEKILGGLQEDFFLQDMVNLPKGSIILKYNPQILPNKLQVSDAFEGIKLIETSSNNLPETINTVIEKMGYSSYERALKEFIKPSPDEAKFLLSQEFNNLALQIKTTGDIIKQKEILKKQLHQLEEYKDIFSKAEMDKNKKVWIDAIKKIDIFEKYHQQIEKFSKAWNQYCQEQQYFTGLHTQSPWFKGELALTIIDATKNLNRNSWGKQYKQIVIELLDEAMSTIPKNKTIGFDISKTKKIIEKSDTPEQALNQLAKELKIKAMPPRDKNIYSEINHNEDNSWYLEMMLAILRIKI